MKSKIISPTRSTMKPTKQHWVLYGLTLFLLAYIVLIATGFAKTEFEKKPLAKELIEEGNVAGLYDFYLSTTPDITKRPWYGSENASITIIVYLTPTSSASKTFMKEYLPQLERDYITEGKVKLIYKNYLTSIDVQEKSDTFLYAQAFSCVSKIYPEQYYPLLVAMYNTGEKPEKSETEKIEEEVETMLQTTMQTTNNVSTEALSNFNGCLNGDPLTEPLYDLSEVENFGINGILPRIYIGINGRGNTLLNGLPKYEKIKKTIRDYQVRLGD